MPDVLIYRRPGCMFCEQVEELLRENDIPFKTEEVQDREEQERVSRRHGALAFPLVLVDGQYIGGFTHIIQLHSEGRLRSVLQGLPEDADAAAAPPPPKPGSLGSFAALGNLMRQRRGEDTG